MWNMLLNAVACSYHDMMIGLAQAVMQSYHDMAVRLFSYHDMAVK